jgi:hypothetical protein
MPWLAHPGTAVTLGSIAPLPVGISTTVAKLRQDRLIKHCDANFRASDDMVMKILLDDSADG